MLNLIKICFYFEKLNCHGNTAGVANAKMRLSCSRFSPLRSHHQRSLSNLCHETQQDRRPKAQAPPPLSPPPQLRRLLPAPPPPPAASPPLRPGQLTPITAEGIQPSAGAPLWPVKTAAWRHPTCGGSTRTVCCRRTPSPRPASTSPREPSIRSECSDLFLLTCSSPDLR